MDCEEYKTLYVNGQEYRTRMCRKYPDVPKWKKQNPKQVLAFIPGTIREIFVKEGDTVKKGQNLLILEAMKMKNRLKAPMNGEIKKIFVASDENVTKNQLLIEYK